MAQLTKQHTKLKRRPHKKAHGTKKPTQRKGRFFISLKSNGPIPEGILRLQRELIYTTKMTELAREIAATKNYHIP